MLAPGGRVRCGGSIEGRGSSVRRVSRHQKRKRPQVLPRRGASGRKQPDRPRGDGGGESRQKGPGSAQVDTGQVHVQTGFRDMLITTGEKSKERDPRREMGWAVVKVKERQQEEASAYPSEQLGVTSSLGARHGFEGRASNCRWYGVGGVAAGCGDVAWSAVALLPGRDGRWVPTTDQAPDVRDQGCDWRWWHADSGRARPQRGASQASPRMAGQIAIPLTGCVALVHLQDAIPAVSRLLAGSSAAPNALGCSSPRGSNLFDSCAVGPLSVFGIRCSVVQCTAMRCDAMLCYAAWSECGQGVALLVKIWCCLVLRSVSNSLALVACWLGWQRLGTRSLS